MSGLPSHAQTEFSIPEETIRIACAAYPRGNTLMKIRDTLGTIYQDQAFTELFPHNGRAVEAPWRLALITVLQFMEELPDRQAADAVRGRIDWKYLLGLDLADPGFDASVLCEFRQRWWRRSSQPHALAHEGSGSQCAHACEVKVGCCCCSALLCQCF